MAEAKICRMLDCDKPPCAHGLCRKHYGRLRRTGDPMGIRPRPPRHVARWVTGVCLGYDGDDCLIWPFTRNPTNGYPYWNGGGPSQSAGRTICEKVHGPPPEHWYQAAHSCGRGHDGCVNPRHLVWKKPVDNHADKVRHGTHIKGARHVQAKLTDEQAAEIRLMAGSVTQASLARRFGVSHVLISKVINGLSYA